MRAHEAGALHADAVHPGPGWLRPPGDINDLLAPLWPAGVSRRPGGELAVAGVDVRDLAAEFGTPAYVLDEADFRARARAFRDAFAAAFGGAADVYYAAKSFVSGEVVRWIEADGLHLDVCTGGELAVALRAGFPAGRVELHGNNKSPAEIDRALEAGVGIVVLDSETEIGRVERLAAVRGMRPRVLVRVTVGVEAHTHEYIATAHEDQKFGFSLTDGDAGAAVRRVIASPHLELAGLHSHIGSQIFDTAGFEVAARRVVGLLAQVRAEHGVEPPLLNLGGGFGIAYTSQDDPATPAELADGLADIVTRECRAEGLALPRIAVEPGRAIAGPSTFTLYEVGTVKSVELATGGRRTYVAVDGGMSDNIRAALYDASYSCTIASRASTAPPVLARVVGKHCESGDVVVPEEFLPGDVAPGDLLAVPATGAYCRSMASNYNSVPRPPVVAVTGGRGRVLLRRETEADLLALDTAFG